LPQAEIDSIITTFSDLLFANAGFIAFETLREFLENRINRNLTSEVVRREIRAEGKLTLKVWELDPTLSERLSNETSAYLGTYVPFGAGGELIPRAEAVMVFNRIWADDRPSVILLTGVAGSGKSGVIRELIGKLVGAGIPHLALRIDHYLDCTTPNALGKAVTDREESPAATLKGIATDKLSVLIIDQVDAVSEVSGRNGAVKQAVLRIVDDARNFGNVVLVVSCRTFDLESDRRLKALKDVKGAEHVNVGILKWQEEVRPLLLSKAIDPEQFSLKQRDLICLPLNLTIFLDTFDGSHAAFSSRNDLFAQLLEKKTRWIREQRQAVWDTVAPLAKLAEWMSERQRLDAPADLIEDFAGAVDFLSSEGLIVRSRHNVNFFHESFFDYIYARTFASRAQTIEQMLSGNEQHLFRRTQVRQILETLRQSDSLRYVRELKNVILSEIIRFHIKVAIAQWLGSQSDPLDDEKAIILALDHDARPFPLLVRSALLSSVGWFDKLLGDGWIMSNLGGSCPERAEALFWWLSSIAGQRPVEVADLLDRWWGGAPERGRRLLDWFGLVKRNKPDQALIDLCCRLMESNPQGLFEGNQSNRRDLLLHTWAGDNPTGAADVLKAYFKAWFEAHPNQHPFEHNEFRDIDGHSLGEMAKKAPEAFARGTSPALARSIAMICEREARGQRDFSFNLRYRSGHHVRADAFLDLFRNSMQQIAGTNSALARELLRGIDPTKHEVSAHLWLETIQVNPAALHDLFTEALGSPHVVEAGWHGADWKSFADCAKTVIPFLQSADREALRERVPARRRHRSGILGLCRTADSAAGGD
jgi:ATPase family associated with various cellular activities (AAA)